MFLTFSMTVKLGVPNRWAMTHYRVAACSKPGSGTDRHAYAYEAPLREWCVHLREWRLHANTLCSREWYFTSTLHFCKWSFTHECKHPLLLPKAPFAGVEGVHGHCLHTCSCVCVFVRACLPLIPTLRPGLGHQVGKVGDRCAKPNI